MSNPNEKNECVGSLIVHQSDVQELSEAPPARDSSRDECVGSLLVHQSDMQELAEAPVSNLTRRVTEKVVEAIQNTEHVSTDDDILNWQCDV